jgi:hypothetical protein
MIGVHGQYPINNWLDAIKIFPAGTPFLSVNDVHMLRDAKSVNPGLRTIFRKKIDIQAFTPDYEQAKQKARDYFNSFIDGTWQQQGLWQFVDVVKEWNEYVASSQNEAERQLIITWLNAVTTVWNQEYRGKPIVGGRDIPLACLSVAIGNDIDHRYAKIIADSGNIISYHNYTHFFNGKRDPEDWKYHSGRWTEMDKVFLSQGIQAKWISTEGGIYEGVYDGWKSSKTVGGNLQRYIDECIKYQLEKVSAWNKANNNRYLGSVLFTFGNTGSWPQYELNTAEMIEIAKVVRDYQPVTPPPVTDWKSEVWAESIERQAISLNPNAALQMKIFADNFVPVQSEFYYTAQDGINRACMAAEHLQTGERRVYYAVVPNWSNVQWFKM